MADSNARLSEYLLRQDKFDLAAGRDCARWVAGALEAFYGYNPISLFLGNYTTLKGQWRHWQWLLARYNVRTLPAFLEKQGWTRRAKPVEGAVCVRSQDVTPFCAGIVGWRCGELQPHFLKEDGVCVTVSDGVDFWVPPPRPVEE